MSAEIVTWWFFLCAVSGLNILAWLLSAAALERRKGVLPADVYTLRRLQLLLSAGYVFGCAFRSVLPVYDVPRLCLFDSWMSSAIVGRSVATVAELCFAAQWALLLREMARTSGSVFSRTASLMVVPLITIAESCSWYSVLTTSNLGHVVEETICGLCAALLVISLIASWPRCNTVQRPLLAACCAAGIAYIAYMFMVDVPMYWMRWIADEAAGRTYLSISQGVLDASQRWTVSHRWEDWTNEVVWMSMYFSVGVWFSIALVHAQVPKHRAPDKRNRMPIALAKIARSHAR